MNALTLQGHSPAVRASRALRAVNVRKMCSRALELARRASLPTAVSDFYQKCFGTVTNLSYICSAKLHKATGLPLSFGYSSDIFGHFLCPDTYQPYGCHILTIFALRRQVLCSLATGYDSRFSVCKPNSQDMKAISLKAQGPAVNVPFLISVAGNTVRRHSMAIAILAALATYAGVLVGSDPLTYSAAFTALAAVGIANSRSRRPAKGGAE